MIGSTIVLVGISSLVWIGSRWSQSLHGADCVSNMSVETTVERSEKEWLDSCDGSRLSGEVERVLLPEVDRLMKEFDESEDPQFITKAVAATRQHTPDLPEEAIDIRIALLRRLSPSYDPVYDTSPPPSGSIRVMPPVGYYVGVPPEEIKDPTMRMEYIEKIKEMEEYSRIRATQKPIRKLMNDLVRLYSIQNGANIVDFEQQLQKHKLPLEMIDSMLLMARQKEIN